MIGKQRAYLRKLAHELDPIFQVGKAGVTPDLTKTISEALEKRELIKITILKNCAEDVKHVAETISERTQSEVIQVIGRKFVLYRKNTENPVIVVPKL